MMPHVNLLRSLPRVRRNVAQREQHRTAQSIAVSKRFGVEYFDGPRRYGYGGYYYDGRWQPVARDIIAHYGLKPGAKVLDVGCAKGFLVLDLMSEGMDVRGLDISMYALRNCPIDLIGRLDYGSADSLPYSDGWFDLALSINTLHNLPRDRIITALRELGRVSKRQFVQLDSYRTVEEQRLFQNWVLTAEYHGFPEQWLQLFAEAGYSGDYDWTIVQ